MPKDDDFLGDRREHILECAGEILKEKHVYLITMQDVVKKTGFSQAAIGRYYSNLDDIFVDYINEHTTRLRLENRIDKLLSSELPEGTVVSECLMALGEYIGELLETVFGKAFLELLILYSGDFQKRAVVFPRLRYKQSLEYAINRTMEYTLIGVQKGVFRPQYPVRSIVVFISAFIDGLAENLVLLSAAGEGNESGSAIDVPEMFEMLAKTAVGFLNSEDPGGPVPDAGHRLS